MSLTVSKRAVWINMAEKAGDLPPISQDELNAFEFFDLVYRALVAMMYNFVPGSGHPGGSISSGRIVQSLMFHTMDYDVSDPESPTADLISYAAGHKALGLYGLWALRNEVVRVTRPDLLPANPKMQFRLEDLLGFRRNPVNDTPLFRQFGARALDGHPTPATPFLKLSTGASGVGDCSTTGLALAAMDIYRDDPPRVHMIEGEGGMTPGRVSEAMACAATTGLKNLFMHLDWNQASIDSNRVCREEGHPGDYVQWDPAEFAYAQDWNVVYVPDGKDFRMVLLAQRRALDFISSGQPTAIVYRTVKGWQYGIEGKASHGAGHKFCSEGFQNAIAPLLGQVGARLPLCPSDAQKCAGVDPVTIEACYWDALKVVREVLEANRDKIQILGDNLAASRERLQKRARQPRANAPRLGVLFDPKVVDPLKAPAELELKPGAKLTIREALGNALGWLNRQSGGAVLAAAADLMGSTSTSNVGKGFPEGFLDFRKNPDARLVSIGGICEDAIAGVLSGVAAYGWHTGAGSSYGAFMAPLSHIAARLHAIGSQSRQQLLPDYKFHPFFVVCAHAGLKTGEDGPTHACPQPLQLFQENFVKGTMITLTPWEPAEIWPLVAAALRARPTVIAPFVTRPVEAVPDRAALKFAPAADAAKGLYALRRADPKRKSDGTIVLQESGVMYAFAEQALPRIDKEGFNLNLFYVASAELFDALPAAERDAIYPEDLAREAMGITGFTLPTMYRWILSRAGRERTLYPFKRGHYLGSGQAAAVLKEARLDGESQFQAIVDYVKSRR